ncbi:MAG: Smr/MutS family protein [Deltaproteobacteria bacterium]|nr:Smr/MutS family protein [Deltaproteobacteria bacterium]
MTAFPPLDFDPRGKAAARLGWPELHALLASLCATPMGRQEVDGLRAPGNLPELRARLGEVGELQALREQGERAPLGAFPEIRPHLSLLEKSGVLEGEALREVAAALRISSDAAAFLDRFEDRLPGVRAHCPGLGGFEALGRRIQRSIDPSGEVTDEASEAVRAARTRLRGLHERTRRRAEALVESPEWKPLLQEGYVSVRGERYVLPVLASHRNRVDGIVHNVSNTGQTVFIEPAELAAAGNELAVAAAEAEAAAREVLVELGREVHRIAPELAEHLSTLGTLDLLDACAGLAVKLRGSLPELEAREGADLDLRGLRHPLLHLKAAQEKKQIVENHLVVHRGQCLVVSGPNAGGKTVSVTGAALCVLLLRHGIPPPVHPDSHLPLFGRVQAVVGDEQDLHQDLSSFGAHLRALREVVEEADGDTLVVIDEIASGTDPREGAAIALAFLEELLARGATVLVTTHLAALRALAGSDERFAGAAMGFDPATRRPTYRLIPGASAGSGALAAAEEAGLPERILRRASALLEGDAGPLQDALDRLEEATRETEVAQREAQAARAEAEAAQAAADAERARLEEERARVKEEAREELIAEIEAARQEVKSTIAALQSERSLRQADAAAKHLEALEAKQRAAAARARGAGSGGEVRADLPSAGDTVRAPSLGDRQGEVLSVEGDEALVQMGALKVRQPLEALVVVSRKARKESPRATGGDELGPSERLDLRGARVEEALSMLEKRLDELMAVGASRLEIIHGHGTGALKQAVRDFLKRSPYVQEVHTGDSSRAGDGFTVAKL